MFGIAKNNKLQELDTQLFYQLNRISKHSIKNTSKWVSKTGDGYLYLVIALATIILSDEFSPDFFYTALAAFAVELPIYLILKNVVKRNRPFEKLVAFKSHISPSDKFSMPSGHSAAAFLFATVVASYFPTFAVFAYLWASLIALSRVLLGVHFPGDTIIGAALGVACAEFIINTSITL
mgnify:FL=1